MLGEMEIVYQFDKLMNACLFENKSISRMEEVE